MGNIPTPDYEEGAGCAPCFGIGKTFGDVSTPSKIKATFSGISNCPLIIANPNRSWVLEQDGSCGYEFADLSDWVYVSFYILDGIIYKSWAGLWIFPFERWFFFGYSSICSTQISNENTQGECLTLTPTGYGGSCEIFWGPEIK